VVGRRQLYVANQKWENKTFLLRMSLALTATAELAETIDFLATRRLCRLGGRSTARNSALWPTGNRQNPPSAAAGEAGVPFLLASGSSSEKFGRRGLCAGLRRRQETIALHYLHDEIDV
jgi:hypothetical protein